MTTRVLFCDGCGAPLDAPWAELVIVCTSCGVHNLPGKPGALVPLRAPADGRPRLNLGGRTYVIEGRIALGESSTVYRARWVVRLGELVVIKVLSAMTDADLFRREWRTLNELQRSNVQGAEHYVTRLPTPVAHGLIDSERPRPASVFGWKSGFVHTLEQVGQHHSDGVPGQAQVWILKRLLELLGFVHRSGYVHGAVVPDHILIHPRDHGAMLVGWTMATPWSNHRTRELPATSRRWEKLYAGTRQATPSLDIAMACRCIHNIAGWHLKDVFKKSAVSKVIALGMKGDVADAWSLRNQLIDASTHDFGPPAYHPLEMPGWGAREDRHGLR